MLYATRMLLVLHLKNDFYTPLRFVCAKAAVHAAGRVTVFRTYEHPDEPNPNPPIWQVALATSAAPTFFDQTIVDGVRYVDGGMGCNNPVKVVMNEADNLYTTGAVFCIISIGAGQAETIDIRHRLPWYKRRIFRIIPIDVIRAIQAIATNCEADADDIHRRLRAYLSDKIDDFYVRLNVDRGIQNIRLDKWERLGDVQAFTSDYLGGPEATAKASRAVKGMMGRQETQSLSKSSIIVLSISISNTACSVITTA